MNNTLSKYFSDLYSGNKKLNFEEVSQLLEKNKEEIRLLNLADFLSYLDTYYDEDTYISNFSELAFEIIKYLVENAIDLNLKSKNGIVPLTYAIKLDRYLTINISQNGPQNSFYLSGYQLTKFLLEKGVKLENNYSAFYNLINGENSTLYNDDRGFLQVAIDLQVHDLIELVVQKHIENNVPFAKGYCLNPLFDLRKEDEMGNQFIETKEESKHTVDRIIKTLKLFEKAGVRISEHFYQILYNPSKPIKTNYDSTIKDAIDLRKKLYIFDKGESTLTLLKHLINIGAKIHDEDIRKTIFELQLPDTTALLINNGANVNYFQGNDRISLLMEVCSSEKLHRKKIEFVQLLVENGADINYKDSMGNTVLFKLVDAYQDSHHIDQYEDENGEMKTETFPYPEFPSEKIMRYLIDKGVDINSKNHMGMTPLMHYTLESNDRLVKILLDNGADINVKIEVTAYDLATKDEIKKIIANTRNHEPQKLVNILKNFRTVNPIRFTTHEWDKTLRDNYTNFEDFLEIICSEWDKVSVELEQLSPNLYKKIYNFLLSKEASEKWYSKGGDNIAIGWSSLGGLQEWCDNGNNPFDYKLQQIYTIEGHTITTFGEIIELFKHEFQIRNQHNVFDKEDMLEELFIDIEEKILDESWEVSYENIEKKEFYTDIENFIDGIEKIFKEIHKNQNKSKKIKIKVIDDKLKSYYDIKIIHVNSKSGHSSKDMQKKIEGGNLISIKESLKNLCEWSIESSHEDENYRINFLYSNNVEKIKPLSYEPKGFTHILRVYK